MEAESRNKPDPNRIHPIAGYDREIYVKPTITNPSILVGDFTYIADAEFESHVTHFYPWSRDRLIIGKFCQIASDVKFLMNGMFPELYKETLSLLSFVSTSSKISFLLKSFVIFA